MSTYSPLSLFIVTSGNSTPHKFEFTELITWLYNYYCQLIYISLIICCKYGLITIMSCHILSTSQHDNPVKHTDADHWNQSRNSQIHYSLHFTGRVKTQNKHKKMFALTLTIIQYCRSSQIKKILSLTKVISWIFSIFPSYMSFFMQQI